jgi:hypothetical protein
MAIGGVVAGVSDAAAQWSRGDSDWCEEYRGNRDRERHCLTLEGDFADVGRLEVDGGMNGGVEVTGWSGDRVRVRAKITAWAGSEARAEQLAESVQLDMRGGRLAADGPSADRRENWSVSWEIMVPRNTDLAIDTHNGGVSVADVHGRIEFEALNGGVHLTGVGGEVTGRTTNGGLHIELDGRSWDGAGLDISTTNGGVTLEVPADYSARLETGTVNGGIELDFPVMVQGRIGKRLATDLGEGGATVRATTTNGGVRIVRATTIR